MLAAAVFQKFFLHVVALYAVNSNFYSTEDKTMLGVYHTRAYINDVTANVTYLAPLCEVHWTCPPGFSCAVGSSSKVRNAELLPE